MDNGTSDEDSEYVEECYELIRKLKAENIIFTGKINTQDYIGKMDIMLLTSISEGQPLTILEGFAQKAFHSYKCGELLWINLWGK